MEAGYCLGIGKSIQTYWTSNVFFEIPQQRLHRSSFFHSNRTHPILVQCDSGKLGPFKGLLVLQKQFALHCRQAANQIWIFSPSDPSLKAEVLISFKGHFLLKMRDLCKLFWQKQRNCTQWYGQCSCYENGVDRIENERNFKGRKGIHIG